MTEEKWTEIKERFLKLKGVQKQGESLKINRKMFAMWSHETFVLKMPKERVSELLESKVGLPYDPGNGKIMKEWVIIPEKHINEWIDFTKKAKEFALFLSKK